MEKIKEFLKEVSIFSELNEQELDLLTKACHKMIILEIALLSVKVKLVPHYSLYILEK